LAFFGEDDPETSILSVAWDRPMGSHTPSSKNAHVIVLGNEKGGSGKSTTAVNIIVALIKAGHRVASIDTDSRQLSLTRYIENRSRWARRSGLALEVPTHFSVRLGEGEVVAEVEAREFAAFAEIVERLGERFDFVVIDTPGNDSYRMRLSHAMADTLVTPVNDSFVDLDVLGRIDAETMAIRNASQYAELVLEARRNRMVAGQPELNWVVVRNRISTLASRNQKKVIDGLAKLAALLNFRIADGISERVIFREFFPMGLTAFDTLDPAVLGVKPTMSHVAARREIRELIDRLRLPMRWTTAAPVAGGMIATLPESVPLSVT
jgi:chromosome partitioning protein